MHHSHWCQVAASALLCHQESQLLLSWSSWWLLTESVMWALTLSKTSNPFFFCGKKSSQSLNMVFCQPVLHEAFYQPPFLVDFNHNFFWEFETPRWSTSKMFNFHFASYYFGFPVFKNIFKFGPPAFLSLESYCWLYAIRQFFTLLSPTSHHRFIDANLHAAAPFTSVDPILLERCIKCIFSVGFHF